MGTATEYSINFPNLHIHLNHVIKSFSIGEFSIAMYGVVIALGIIAGIMIAAWEAKRTGQSEEDYYDLAFFAIFFSVIGARLYYVAFRYEHYVNDPLSILNIREGGLAIYGAVIAAVITVVIFAKKKKKSIGLMLDTGCLGLVMGQIIGRWGNFFNREVFGGYTDNIFAMQIPLNSVRDQGEVTQAMMDHIQRINGIEFIQVHPTFLYEILWNIGVFIALNLFKRKKKYEGEVFLLYLAGYGLGRAWIEGVRTDQLYLWNTHIAVSQVLSILLIVISIAIDLYMRKKSTKNT